jgi:hypothetical protein
MKITGHQTINIKQLRFANILQTAAFAIFGFFILYSYIYLLNYHYHIIACPYPLEYREGANILPTDLLLQGKNPFDYLNNPQSANLYRIFYNLLVFPFAIIWGPTLLLHRIVSGCFLYACCLIIFIILRKDKRGDVKMIELK